MVPQRQLCGKGKEKETKEERKERRKERRTKKGNGVFEVIGTRKPALELYERNRKQQRNRKRHFLVNLGLLVMR